MMLKTGKGLSEGQSFHRQLLSEYVADITLDNYVSYFELKPIAKKIEHIRQELESRYRDQYAHCKASAGSSPKAGMNTAQSQQLPMQQQHPRDVSAAVTPIAWRSKKDRPFTSSFDEPATAFTMGRQMSAATATFVDPLSPPFFHTEAFAELKATDDTLAALIQSRIELQETFFEKLHESYLRVKRYLIKLECDFIAAAAELRSFNEDRIRNELPRSYIPSLYLRLEVIIKYRALNLLAFRKIMKKFLERCACDSLELLQRVMKIDRLIYASNISKPSFDFRSAALDLVVVYGTVFRLTYEQSVDHMKHYENRTGVVAKRILPNSQTFYVGDVFPHHERPGSFAVRVLSGTCSLFCEKMITEVLQCPRFPVNSCGRFANGEISVKLQSPVRGDDIFIVQSMVALESENLSNAGALMELLLLLHSVQAAAAARITAVIPYLAYTRNVASISAVAEMIESAGCHHVVTVDMHSDQVEGMFSIPMESVSAMYEFVRYISNLLESEGNTFENITIVAPNGEFLGRAKGYADALMTYNHLDSATQFVSVCTAVRRVETQPCASPSNYDCMSPSVCGDAEQQPKSQKVPVPVPRQGDSGTPCSSGFASLQTCNVLSSPPRDTNVVQYMHSPTSPNAADAVTPELVAVVGGASPAASISINSNYGNIGITVAPSSQNAWQQRNHDVCMDGSGSTRGIEKALRQQEEGRQSVIMRKEADKNDYKNYVLVGDVKDRLCIIIDTVIDEALNIAHVARCLHDHGAERIMLVATHAVLSGKAVDLLVESPIELIIVTDSVNQDELMKNPSLARKLRVVPIAPLLASAIEKIHTENTLASLFEKS